MIAFDKEYWDYVATRWPEAYLDFKAFAEERLMTEDFKPWTITATRQERLIDKFGEVCGIYYENPYTFSYACGMIYEWFCKYSMIKGYLEGLKQSNNGGRIIPEALYGQLPDKYKAA